MLTKVDAISLSQIQSDFSSAANAEHGTRITQRPLHSRAKRSLQRGEPDHQGTAEDGDKCRVTISRILEPFKHVRTYLVFVLGQNEADVAAAFEPRGLDFIQILHFCG